MTQKFTAVCGLDCKKCGAYIALHNNDNEVRIKTAREWTETFGHDFAPEDINCVGCCEKSGIHGGYCDACPLRSCASSKDIQNCYVCPEFNNCETRQDFEAHSGMSIENNFLKRN